MARVITKLITGSIIDFEDKLNAFVGEIDNYAIQYRPVFTDKTNRIEYTALVMYQEVEENE